MRAVRDNSVARFKSGKDDLTAAVGIAEDDPLLLRLIAFSQQPDIRAGRIMQYGTQRDRRRLLSVLPGQIHGNGAVRDQFGIWIVEQGVNLDGIGVLVGLVIHQFDLTGGRKGSSVRQRD